MLAKAAALKMHKMCTEHPSLPHCVVEKEEEEEEKKKHFKKMKEEEEEEEKKHFKHFKKMKEEEEEEEEKKSLKDFKRLMPHGRKLSGVAGKKMEMALAHQKVWLPRLSKASTEHHLSPLIKTYKPRDHRPSIHINMHIEIRSVLS